MDEKYVHSLKAFRWLLSSTDQLLIICITIFDKGILIGSCHLQFPIPFFLNSARYKKYGSCYPEYYIWILLRKPSSYEVEATVSEGAGWEWVHPDAMHTRMRC